MKAFFDIINFSTGCLFWGILIGIICMVIFFLLIKGWYKHAEASPATYLVGGILFILLSIQCTMIAGAIKIINTTDYYEEQLERIVEESTPTTAVDKGKDILGNLMSMYLGSNPLGSSEDREVSKAESEKIVDQLVDEYPILSNYFNSGYFVGYRVKDLPHAMAETIRDYMKEFIVYRLLWCLGFVIVGAFVVIKTMSFGYAMERRSSRREGHSHDYTSRRGPRASGRRRR